MSLSLCMITKNEEKFLGKCLDSVRTIVDEIIIVDTGSTDRTKEIAKNFDAKIIDFKWTDNFAAARNESLKHASKDWILVLDADETIAEKDLAKIKRLTEDKTVDGYKLIQRNYSGKGKAVDDYDESKGFSSFVPSVLVRLFQNKRKHYFNNIIHEVVEDSIRDGNGKISVIDIPIHHFAALKDKEFQGKKESMYLEMVEKQMSITPKNPKPYCEMGKMYKNKNEMRKAIGYFEKSLELLKGKEGLAIHELIYFDLGEAYINLKEFEKAKSFIEKAISLNPKHKLAYFYLGLILDEKNDLDNAIVNYAKAISLNPKAENAYNNLAVLYLKKKEYQKAHNVLGKAIALNHPKKEQMKELLKEIEKKLGYSYSVSVG